jgi:hypothetical protein
MNWESVLRELADSLRRALQGLWVILVRVFGGLEKRDYIELCVLSVLAGTLIATVIAVGEQRFFNYVSLRPFIYCKLHDEPLKVGIQPTEEYEKGYIRVSYVLFNVGKTPARQVSKKSVITDSDTFPEEFFKKPLIDTMAIDVVPDHPVICISDMRFIGKFTNEADVLEKIRGKAFYFHIYIQYLDYYKKRHYFRTSYSIEYKGDTSLEWRLLYSSDEKIK